METPRAARLQAIRDKWFSQPLQVQFTAPAGVAHPEPTTCDELVIGLSDPVERAVESSVGRLVSQIHQLIGIPPVTTELDVSEGALDRVRSCNQE